MILGQRLNQKVQENELNNGEGLKSILKGLCGQYLYIK